MVELEREPSTVTRRAPFSDNPALGERGRLARLRILAAALDVFGEHGYHQTGIVRITEAAGCSRASFYQYFSSKEDVFRHLGGFVARELTASAEALGPVTADAAGWRAVRDWVERHAEIYARYLPVFDGFQAAAQSDHAIAAGSTRIEAHQVGIVVARVDGSDLARRRLDGTVALLLNLMTRTANLARVLSGALPAGALPGSRVRGALTDVVHRTMFGLVPGVNVRPVPRKAVPRVRLASTLLKSLTEDPVPAELTPLGERTLHALLDAAHEVLVTRGYHGTRIDDIAAAADVSHGAFYRYFDNKDQLVRILAMRAIQRTGLALEELPDVAAPDGHAALRRWLRRYASAYAAEAAMIRVWGDATAGDPLGTFESAAAIDWGRSRMVRFLRRRRFAGDVQVDALLLTSLLDVLGGYPKGRAAVEPAALVVERGLLGL